MNKRLKILFSFLVVPAGLFWGRAALAAQYDLQMPLPGMPGSVAGPAEYIRYLFTFGLSLVGFLAVVAIIIGGVQYMLSGSVGGVDKAKSTIIGAVSGVGLLLCSYLLLATIDPSLTNLTPASLASIEIAPHEGFTLTEQQIKTSNLAKGDYGDIINAMATKYNVPPNLIRAIIMAESSGNPNALGPQTKYGQAVGLMQLLPSTAKDIGITGNLNDPATNIEAGTKYLSILLNKYNKDSATALAAYNWGPGNVNKKGTSSLPAETQKYIPKVMRYWTNFENKTS